jgi:chromosome segregation ATPase
MGNEKYLNYYVEILTSTMTDAVIRNVSLQANARVTEEVLNDQIKRNEDLINQINNLNDQIKDLKQSNQQTENQKIVDLENKNKGHLDRIGDLEKQLSELNKVKNEYENAKHQISHVDTFRNELVKEREDHQKTRKQFENIIKTLNEEIDYLKLTPAKRKKVDELKFVKVEVKENSINVIDDFSTKAKIIKQSLPGEIIKDGGSF